MKRRQECGEPSALDTAPFIFAHLEDIWNGFFELSSSRNIGFGFSGIRVTEIIAWLDLHCIVDECDRIDYYYLFKFMDGVWLELNNEKTRKEIKNA